MIEALIEPSNLKFDGANAVAIEAPYIALLEKLHADNIEDAIHMWDSFCGGRMACACCDASKSAKQMYCANMLHARLLEKSLGGTDSYREMFHTQSQKLTRWMQRHQLSLNG